MGFLDDMIGIKLVRTDAISGIAQRNTLHFVGAEFTLADDPTNGENILTMLSVETVPPVAISPPTLTTDQTVFNPTDLDTATLVRVSISGNIAIHGIQAPTLIGDTRKTLALVSAGANERLELKHMSSTAAASARLVCPFDASYFLTAFGSIDILYDDTSAVWRVIP